jgi:hypothetical protein
MSIALMSVVWRVPFPTSAQMLIALKLADYANDEGAKIYPSKATLAAQARCSESTVKATLRLFREAGLLIVIEAGGQGPHDTTRYQLNVGLINALASGEVLVSGSSSELTFDYPEGSEKKGSEFDPLAFQGVSGLPVRGQPAARKGSVGNPQSTNNHQEPSARESAGATQSAPATRASPRIRVTASDISWTAWLSEIEARGSAEMRQAAVRTGFVDVEARWPKPEVPLPRIFGAAKAGKMSAAGEITP